MLCCAIIFTAATHSGHLPIIVIKGINKSLSIIKLHPWAIPHEVSVPDEVFNFFAEADVGSWTCCWLLSVELLKLPANPFFFLDLDLLYLLPEPILHNIKLCKRWYVVLLAGDKRQRKSTAYLQWALIWERFWGFKVRLKHQTAFETCRHAMGVKWQKFEVFSFICYRDID